MHEETGQKKVLYYSLKSRLLAVVASTLILVFLLISIVLYQEAKHEVNEIYDAYLLSSSENLFWQADENFNVKHQKNLSEYFAHTYKAIVTKGHISNYDNQAFKEVVQVLRQHDSFQEIPHFLNLTVKGVRWRFYIWHIAKDHQKIGIVAHRLSDRDQALQEILVTLFIPILLSLPLFLFLSVFFISKLSQRLELWGQQLASTTVDNLNQAKIQTNLPKELLPVQNEFNALLQRIEQAQNQQKSFLAYAAHEIKTPLATLKLQWQHLQNQLPSELNSEAFKIQKTLDGMAAITLQLLDLQKIQNEQIRLGEISLLDCVINAYDEIQNIAQQHSIEVVFELPENSIKVFSDSFWLQRILVNLLKNAVIYAEERGPVFFKVTVDHQAQSCLVSIENKGQGLSQVEIEQIQAIFVRLNRHNGSTTGSGIGLSIVAQACDKLKIHWQIHSQENRDNVCVTLQIPLVSTHA